MHDDRAMGLQGKLDCRAVSETRRNMLAFSGGPDSMALLHLLLARGLGHNLEVVHIDHGLDPESALRAERARGLAAVHGIDCNIVRLAIEDREGGTEAAARKARYAHFEARLGPGEYLLTAHHADDQVETVMLRLLRGAGPRGLSGMRDRRRFGAGWLGRPLLDVRRHELLEYLKAHELDWIEDPGNLDTALDRNFLRHEILPAIRIRWPGYCTSILRSAEWQKAAELAMLRDAKRRWEELCRRQPGSGEITLDLSDWLAEEETRAFNVMRWWCEQGHLCAPPVRRLKVFRQQAATSAEDRQPRLAWSGGQLHAWRNRIWLELRPLPQHSWHIDWNPAAATPLPGGGFMILVGEHDQDFGQNWSLCSAPPGTPIRTHPSRPRRPVAELLREAGIPPWRRAAVPLLVVDGEPRALGTEWLDHAFRDWLKRHNAHLLWHNRPATLLPCQPWLEGET